MTTLREFGRRLKAKRKELGLDQAQLAPRFGADQSTLSKLEKGTQEPRHKHLLALSEFLEMDFAELTNLERDPDPSDGYQMAARLVGVVQAGAWVESLEIPPSEQELLFLPSPRQAVDFECQAFEVRGDSMDLVFPEGTIVFAIPTIANGLRPADGDRVIVSRRNDDGEYEATVKEYRIDTENPKFPRAWLHPRSSNPEWQEPLPADDPYMETTITGIVVAAALYEPVLERALKRRRP